MNCLEVEYLTTAGGVFENKCKCFVILELHSKVYLILERAKPGLVHEITPDFSPCFETLKELSSLHAPRSKIKVISRRQGRPLRMHFEHCSL